MAVDSPARIVILGGGPIALEAALYARFLGYEVDVIERSEVASNVQRWGHVRMFSPFKMNCSPLGLAALSAQDESYQPPEAEVLLTGQEWVEQYLLPLSRTDLLVDSLHTQTKVVKVARDQQLKGDLIGNEARADSDLVVLTRNESGEEQYFRGDIVVDVTGTFGNPNHLGSGGLPALGETTHHQEIEFGVPDVTGAQREKYAGQHTLVVGNGYSAATTVVGLLELANEFPETRITWITHTKETSPIHRVDDDPLGSRDELAQKANVAVDSGDVTQLAGATIGRIDRVDGVFAVEYLPFSDDGDDEDNLENVEPLKLNVDRIVANVGYRPDRSIYEELQVHECYATSGPMKLAAALLGDSSENCLTQTTCGPQSLINPEPNFYILGGKSYGRSSNFLFRLGLEQIRELFTIIGDREDLNLYQSTANLSS